MIEVNMDSQEYIKIYKHRDNKQGKDQIVEMTNTTDLVDETDHNKKIIKFDGKDG